MNSLNADALRQHWLSFDEESENLSNQIIEIDTAATGIVSYRIAKPISTFCYNSDNFYDYLEYIDVQKAVIDPEGFALTQDGLLDKYFNVVDKYVSVSDFFVET